MQGLSTLLTAGIGGVTFFAIWAYMIFRWLTLGEGFSLGFWS
jgi:hypothetical protein